MRKCRRCNATEETQPLYGIGENGLCLVCEDKRQRERPNVIGERLRDALADESAEQPSLEVFA